MIVKIEKIVPGLSSSPVVRGFLVAVILILLMAGASSAQAQSATDAAKPNPKTFHVEDSRNPKTFLKHLAEDQKNIWTSPFRVKPQDAQWMVPVAGITTGLIMTDRTTEFEMSRGNRVSLSNNISNVGLAAYGGTMAAFYFSGRRGGDRRREETGILAAEAGLNALAVSEVFKYAFTRDRPNEGDGTGHFFRPGGRSFYSAHSTIAFSFAAVIASEYPGWLSKTLAYGAATGIALARVTGQQHWPSDVFVGGVTGYLIGKSVYKAHHDPDIDGTQFGTFVKDTPTWNSGNAGSTYVPLGDWVYPVLERLRAAGLIRYAYLGLRPWTRTAIAEMVAEAEYRLGESTSGTSALQEDVARLKTEFGYELALGTNLENKAIKLPVSVYSRSMYVAGRPLNDSYHFGQNIINDYGRPYQGGFNQIAGFNARAESGRFAFYSSGEFQHAPGADAYPLSVRQVIAQADLNPVQPAIPFSPANQFRLLDTYASLTVAGNNISVGKQSLWWSQNDGDAMIFSNNAEPIYMVQVNRIIPLKIPLLSKLIGPVRYDFFFGKLTHHQFPPNPYMHGEKISFKPTQNLEFGFSRTAVFAGEGLTPLTFGTFWSSMTSTTSSTNPGADQRNSPGVRHSQFDFSYRIPGLRNWLTIYSDSLVHDDVSPVDAPRRAALNPGFYLSHFPKLSKLDLRVEAVSTDPPIPESNGGHFFYWESRYHDVYLNKPSLMGSWIGREGKGIQARSTYWLSPVSTVQFSYRNAKVAKDFIPDGETFNSYSLKAKIRVMPQLEVESSIQYDRWKAAVLAPDLQSNVTTSVQITYWPKRWRAESSKKH